MWILSQAAPKFLYGTDLQFGIVYESSQSLFVTPIKAVANYDISIYDESCRHLLLILSGSEAGRCYLPSSKKITYKQTSLNIKIELS